MKVQLTQIVTNYTEHTLELFPNEVSAVHQVNEKDYCVVIAKGVRYLVKGTQEEIMKEIEDAQPR